MKGIQVKNKILLIIGCVFITLHAHGSSSSSQESAYQKVVRLKSELMQCERNAQATGYFTTLISGVARVRIPQLRNELAVAEYAYQIELARKKNDAVEVLAANKK